MKIKKLELLGFKSFKDRTVIHFDSGITGIVGPNGCGKSNIVDALTWVMGEQSAKHLRGQSMEDVIFNGSEDFSPLQMCEVSLTLENDGGAFPAKWAKHTEVMVTRRLHRSGEGEYFINKEAARLKDIVEIFMDTGAGSKGFSVVEQGQIGKIITSKPEDRRVLIEEAAGITKFKARKRESQRKLESTEQNLTRLNDIIGELRKQLDSLQRQAKRAERYKELKTRAQDLDLWLSTKKFVELSGQVDAIAQDLQAKRLQSEECEAQFSTAVAQLQALKLELLEAEKQVNIAQQQQYALKSEVQRTESSIQVLEVEIETTKKNEELAGSLKSEVSARESVLIRDLDHTVQAFEVAQGELTALEAEASDKADAAARRTLEARELDERLTQGRRELMTIVQSLNTVEVKKASLLSNREGVQKRLDESQAILGELQSKRVEFESNRHKAFDALEKQRQLQLAIMSDVENFESNLDELKGELATKRAQVEQFKDEFNAITSRLYGLENLSQNFEGFQQGVRQVMTWQREKLQPLAEGGFELVADIVEVPAEFEVAMEAVLGEKLQTIVSPRAEGSVKAIELLKEKQAGRSSFINQDLAGDGPSDNPSATLDILKQQPGVKAFLGEVAKLPDTHRGLMMPMLNRVVVVDHLSSALQLRPQFSDFTFVTVDGDVLTADGLLTGGNQESADSGLLRQKREIKELAVQKDQVSGKLALATASLDKLQKQQEQLVKDLEAAKKQSFEHEILILEKKKDFERAEQELRNVDEALARQSRDIGNLAKQSEQLTQQLESAEATLNELAERKQSLETAGVEDEGKLLELRSGLDELTKAATDAQVRLATKRQTVETLQSQKTRLATDLNTVRGQLERMVEDSSKNSEFLSQHALVLEEHKSTLNKLISESQEAENALHRIRDQYETFAGQVRTREEDVQKLQSLRHELSGQIAEGQVQVSQAEMNAKYLVDQVLEKYMVNMADIRAEYENREGDLHGAQLELDDLRDKIKKIGEVNLTAIQEYEELTNRYEFLTKQQQDLINAMDSLRKVIDRINRICNRRFKDTFEAVNERFKKVFPVLFGGGEAQLLLLELPENPGEPGVEIMARPPGKKLQSVTLLSGGEKALTAVSLIFAIFLFKPSPFCLLDEVDAPLDDANVYRFNDLVKEMSKRSQVIVVTHNKHTMEINNKLYGVTMENSGVSKMVAVELSGGA